jgi:hypothetical protein
MMRLTCSLADIRISEDIDAVLLPHEPPPGDGQHEDRDRPRRRRLLHMTPRKGWGDCQRCGARADLGFIEVQERLLAVCVDCYVAFFNLPEDHPAKQGDPR